MKQWFISLLITPKRVRKLIACVISWLLHKCIQSGAWDVVSEFPIWLRKLAAFIDKWNAVELPEDKDKLIADLVADAVTDDAVDTLIERVAALEVECKGSEVPKR